MGMLHFGYPFTTDEQVGCFQFLTIKKDVSLNTHIATLCADICSHFSRSDVWGLMLGLTVAELFSN